MKIFHSIKPKSHKTLLLFLIPILACAGLAFSVNVSAASCSGVDTSIIECEGGGDSGTYHILSTVLDIMNIGIGILAVLGITWAGIQYLTAGDDATRATKARRRLLEIVVGVICYVLLYGFLGWLTPGGNVPIETADLNEPNVSSVSISYSDKTYVGQTFVPKVTFNKDATDKTYSLKSNAAGTVTTSGRGAKCVNTGKASIEVIAANGQRAILVVNCQEEPSEAADAGDGGGVTTTGSQANTKLNGKPNMRKETWKIINDHRRDFYYNNYGEVIHGYNSYRKYVKSLGGVFTQYASRINKSGNIKKIPVKTAADFQAAAEYVWGLMTIWGGDYHGRRDHVWRDGKTWGNTGKSDRFRFSFGGRLYGSRDKSINEKLGKYKDSNYVCSTMLGTFISSTGLKYYYLENDPSNHERLVNRFGGIRDATKLQVGDVVFFLPFSTGNHVAIVGEVYQDYVIIYDGGQRFTKNGFYKFKLNRTKTQSGSIRGSDFTSFGGWVAIRPWQIDQSVTLKGIN